MRKTLNIEIRPLSELFDDFRGAFKAAQQGRSFKLREAVYFTSLEAARNFLTRERLALLHAIRTQRPESLYELARQVGRDFKNVQEDIRLLERHGLVRVARESRGKRTVKVPQVLFEEIALKIAI